MCNPLRSGTATVSPCRVYMRNEKNTTKRSTTTKPMAMMRFLLKISVLKYARNFFIVIQSLYLPSRNGLNIIMKAKIALITGGYTEESEISFRSSDFVYSQLDHERYEVYTIVIAPEDWYYTANNGQRHSID